MQAMILAAGMGKRLGALTNNNTKCMVKVNGVTLIDRVLRQLGKYNLSRVVIVVGYKGELLKEYICRLNVSVPIVFVDNPVYDKTNNIYSLALAQDYLLQEDTLLLESDLIVEDKIIEKIIHDDRKNVALVAKYEPWMDGTMVKIDNNCNIVSFVPKTGFKYGDINSYYKTVNIYKFSKEFSQSYYVPFLNAYRTTCGENEYYEQVLRILTFLDRIDFKALPLDGEKWYEIDDVQDLNIAETIFAENEQQLKKYFKRYGGYWRFPQMLDFCYLVNPYFPPANMKDELRSNFDILLTQYPSGSHINDMLAGKYFKIADKFITVGNGAAELINGLMNSIDGKLGVIYPTFEEYPNRYACEQIVQFVPNNEGFSYTVNDLIAFFNDKKINNLLIINPDNPSGNLLCKEELLSLLTWSKEQQIRMIIDESFSDFSDREDISLLSNDILENNQHLIVVKSISKSYGVPGLRLGVLATSDFDLLNQIKEKLSIWNINSFAEYYMQIFGKYEKAYQNACLKFKYERKRFYEELKKVSFINVFPSQANYFLCKVTNKYTSVELTQALLKSEILIKDCSTKKGFNNANYIRIAIRNEQDNNRLIDALMKM